MPKYRLLAGKHIAGTPDGSERLYKPGDIIDTEENLLRLNGRNMPPKFEQVDFQDRSTLARVSDEEIVAEAARRGFNAVTSNTGPTTPPLAASAGGSPPVKVQLTPTPGLSALNAMSLKELQAHAAEEEIDLKGATKHQDVLRIILASRSEQVAAVK